MLASSFVYVAVAIAAVFFFFFIITVSVIICRRQKRPDLSLSAHRERDSRDNKVLSFHMLFPPWWWFLIMGRRERCCWSLLKETDAADTLSTIYWFSDDSCYDFLSHLLRIKSSFGFPRTQMPPPLPTAAHPYHFMQETFYLKNILCINNSNSSKRPTMRHKYFYIHEHKTNVTLRPLNQHELGLHPWNPENETENYFSMKQELFL